MVDAIVCVLLIEYVGRSLERETEAKQHEALLKDELQHRIQNLFAVIQAVIRFSLPSNEARVSAAAIKDGLLDRLQAMVDASRHVSDAKGEVALIDLIHDQMRVFAERYTVHGRPQVTLNAQLTQNFALILHELVTNSLKYGALSAADGSVQIKLQEVPTGVLFDWTETGGPAVSATRRRLGRRFRLAYSRPVCAELLRRRRHRLRADGLALQFATATPAKRLKIDCRPTRAIIGRERRLWPHRCAGRLSAARRRAGEHLSRVWRRNVASPDQTAGRFDPYQGSFRQRAYIKPAARTTILPVGLEPSGLDRTFIPLGGSGRGRFLFLPAPKSPKEERPVTATGRLADP